MMNPFDRFLSNFRVHYPGDGTKWQYYKQRLATKSVVSPRIFWYLSSGMDTMAFYYFGGESPGYGMPKAEWFIFSDNGVVFNDPESLKQKTDSGEPELLPSRRGSFLLKNLIPLHFIHKKTEPEGQGIPPNLSSFSGAPVFFLEIQPDSKNTEAKKIPVLFIRNSNALVCNLLLSHSICVDYICTVTDGCRPGTEDNCPNEHFSFYDKVLKQDGIWITDHFNRAKPKILYRIAELKDWGHYDLNDKSYCYSKKYV